MRWGTVAIVLSGVLGFAADDVAAAPPKSKLSPQLRRYDFNQDGKLNTMERANSRLMKAQQREWRAVQRNNAMVR